MDLEAGTAVFTKCTTAEETLPCGQKMTTGDFAIALRWLERLPVPVELDANWKRLVIDLLIGKTQQQRLCPMSPGVARAFFVLFYGLVFVDVYDDASFVGAYVTIAGRGVRRITAQPDACGAPGPE